MKLNLTVWDRVTLTQILYMERAGVNLGLIRSATKLFDVLEFTPEEEREIGLRQTETGGYKWEDDGREYQIELPDGAPVDYLRQVFEAFEGWGSLVPQQRQRVLDLAEKLDV